MATVYHRDQPGAPALPYTMKAGWAAAMPALKLILKACLVEGYAGSMAAGWELIDEGPTYIVLRNGTQSGYVCLTSTETYYLDVYLSETYTGFVSGAPSGAGMRSGSGGVRQNYYSVYMMYGPAASSWALVADASTFILSVAGHHTDSVMTLSGWNSAAGGQSLKLYVGEDAEGNFLSLGGQNLRASYASSDIDSRGHTVLKDPATGFLLGASASLSVATHELQIGQGISAGSFSDGAVLLGEVPLCPSTWTASGRKARLKGLAHIPVLSARSPQGASLSLGGPTMTLRTINTLFDLGTGHGYFLLPRACQDSLGNVLLTDDPEFW